jgi:import inner membrane translocase subunit TIM9
MAFQQAMLTEESLRNFKEFLEIYNRTTERCFRDCIVDLSRRDLTTEEDKCLDDCTTKLTKLNHRLLGTFMVEQPRFTQKKIEQAEKDAAAMQAMQQSTPEPVHEEKKAQGPFSAFFSS